MAHASGSQRPAAALPGSVAAWQPMWQYGSSSSVAAGSGSPGAGNKKQPNNVWRKMACMYGGVM